MLLRRADLDGILITEDVVGIFIPGNPFAIKSDDDEIACHPPTPHFGVVSHSGPIPTNYTIR